jgi:uncharacterized cupin superfamily protein
MSVLTITRMLDDPSALEVWPAMAASDLESGAPVQRGLMVCDDKPRGLSAGIWDCTAFTGTVGPYSVSEFMILLEGAVTIVDAHGGETVIRAGESFIIPKGLVCQWKQTTTVRKFFVIFDDASGLRVAEPAKLAVIKPDPAVALAPIPGPDPALIVGAQQPVWRDFSYFADLTGQLTTGIWSSTPYERRPAVFTRHELMHILDGEAILTDANGKAHAFKAGETVFVPIGAQVAWKNTVPVRKIYCSFTPNAAGVLHAAAAE